jgi:integrase
MRAPKLETRSARLKLPVAKRPYWTQIGKGVALGYRRNQGTGTWSVRVAKPGGHWSQVIGEADDFADANGGTVMDYWQAADKARSLGTAARHGGNAGQLGTVAEALNAYEGELKLRGRDVGNATRVRMYLPEALAQKPVATLTFPDFAPWRETLIKAGLTPASFNRICSGLRAALNLAAGRDTRITNASVWGKALASLRGANEVRNVVLDEGQIRSVVEHAYMLHGSDFGLLVEVGAITGARVSQIARLRVFDLVLDRNPRLLMPASFKGNERKEILRRPVPISQSLATRLHARTIGRSPDAPLLTKADGEPWRKSNHIDPFADVVSAVGLDPEVTFYSLRHSSITRQLLSGVPARLVAAVHDTSVRLLEANYSHAIAEQPDADALVRRAMLEVNTNALP